MITSLDKRARRIALAEDARLRKLNEMAGYSKMNLTPRSALSVPRSESPARQEGSASVRQTAPVHAADVIWDDEVGQWVGV